MISHETFMSLALEQAQKALLFDEVPIGALIVKDQTIISQAHNLKEKSLNISDHAEIRALELAAKKLGTWRLNGCYLYTTLEPCIMCAGAIQQSRIQTLIYAASDSKGGGVESLYQILTDHRLNHQTEVVAGVLKEESSQLLKSFFQDKRSFK